MDRGCRDLPSGLGQGEADSSGGTGWHSNSGNPIGNGWQNFRYLFGGISDEDGIGHVIHGVTEDGDVLGNRCDGQGEAGVTWNTGWLQISGSLIRRGW
jgi:hypothetical protein